MKVLALLSVDDDVLKDLHSDFSTEMGWVVESGIYLEEWEDVGEDFRFEDIENFIS